MKQIFTSKYLSVVVLLSFVLINFHLAGQNLPPNRFRIVFYNVENFFDCEADLVSNDREFLPQTKRNWESEKYLQKQNNISQVILSVGKAGMPAMVGLCEVENSKVLTDLINNPKLKPFNYQFIHHESPDARGIDVALLYIPELFKPIANRAIQVELPNNETTRDILYISGKTPSNDTLHVFVCHLPSRSRGISKTEPLRLHAASILKREADLLLKKNPLSNIIIMGDFNDYPDDKSIVEVLEAKPLSKFFKTNELYNLTVPPAFKTEKGSYKHRTKWVMMDQIIVSGNMLNSESGFYTTFNNTYVFDSDFLLEDDIKYGGKKPFRTYIGIKYNGGYSDHLPVYTDFWYK